MHCLLHPTWLWCLLWTRRLSCKEKRFSVILNPKINSQVALRIYESKKTESLISPSGVLVHLFEYESPYSLGGKKSILGNYSGVSLETDSLEDSFTFWRQLGFEGSFTPSPGWIELQKNGQQLSIQKSKLCPHVIHNPSLIFFNGKKTRNHPKNKTCKITNWRRSKIFPAGRNCTKYRIKRTRRNWFFYFQWWLIQQKFYPLVFLMYF